MSKYLQYTVYGNNTDYTEGMLRNIEMRDNVYPDYEIVVYYDSTVPEEYIKKYQESCIAIDGEQILETKILRRNIPYNEKYDVLLFRDADSRLYQREKKAVEEFLDSNYTFHLMKDHPHHQGDLLMAGMWGLKKNDFFNISQYIKNSDVASYWGYDATILKNIFNTYSDKFMIHNSLQKDNSNTYPFTVKMDENKYFIGEKFYGDDIRYHQYLDWLNINEL